MDEHEVNQRFEYRPPLSRQRVADHHRVRGAIAATARELAELLPDGREKSVVMTKLEEAMFWGNAALARAADPDAEVSASEAAAGPR